jgi:hypothetical protein
VPWWRIVNRHGAISCRSHGMEQQARAAAGGGGGVSADGSLDLRATGGMMNDPNRPEAARPPAGPDGTVLDTHALIYDCFRHTLHRTWAVSRAVRSGRRAWAAARRDVRAALRGAGAEEHSGPLWWRIPRAMAGMSVRGSPLSGHSGGAGKPDGARHPVGSPSLTTKHARLASPAPWSERARAQCCQRGGDPRPVPHCMPHRSRRAGALQRWRAAERRRASVTAATTSRARGAAC